MSHIIQQYISQCQSAFKPCSQCTAGVCNIDPLCGCLCNNYPNCLDCLGKMFYAPNHRNRRYQCLPITYSYVERFTEIFASEIYRILFPLDNLWNNITNRVIISIGCGPATELIAVEKILRDKSINNVCRYVGFDPNCVWSSAWSILINIFQLQRCNIMPSFQNGVLSSNDTVLKDTKLLILNYVVSDVYKHSHNPSIDTYNFLHNIITPLVQQMPTDSYIFVNDINSYRMGRDEIEEWACSICIAGIDEIGYFEHFEYPQSKFRSRSAKKG